jgi:hypothetical protein
MVFAPWWLWLNRPEGPKIGAKQPVSEKMIFRLLRALISGKVVLFRNDFSPVHTGITARHWRALLFLGLGISAINSERDTRQRCRMSSESE